MAGKKKPKKAQWFNQGAIKAFANSVWLVKKQPPLKQPK